MYIGHVHSIINRYHHYISPLYLLCCPRSQQTLLMRQHIPPHWLGSAMPWTPRMITDESTMAFVQVDMGLLVRLVGVGAPDGGSARMMMMMMAHGHGHVHPPQQHTVVLVAPMHPVQQTHRWLLLLLQGNVDHPMMPLLHAPQQLPWGICMW